MKKFKFSLETLLKITTATEKEQKSILAGINNEINHINSLIEKNRNATLAALDESAGSVTLFDFTRYNNYIEYLKKKREELALMLVQKEFERENAQKKLIEIMTKRKSYEKLREKQFEIYKKEVEAEEAKLLDDYMSGKR
ncbi:MAG: flagellar export protein FliJ [Oscillospiraceae bacterium]|nr:flagellar export protein FliJ [Oscillospiraceae bacterium]